MTTTEGEGAAPVVVRSGANRGAGLFLGIGGLAFTYFADPHGLLFDGFDAQGASAQDLLLMTLGLAALSIGGYTVFARPRLDVWPQDRLVIRNPLREVTIPLARVHEVNDGWGYLRVRSGRRWHTAWGTEQMNYKLAAGEPNAATKLVSVSPDPHAPAEAVRVQWRALGPVEAFFLVAWLPHLIKGSLDVLG